MKENGENLPRKILKSLGIFGGVQGILILCALVRVKLIALFIGTEGVGLFSIFNNAIDMYRELTQLSIQQSAVRNVARNRLPAQLAAIAYIVRRWSWFLGVIGAMLMLVTSPMLSHYCFGSSQYTWAFALLSVVIFMQAIQAGWLIIMQGTEKLMRMVKAQLYGAVVSILLCAPMFYFLGIYSVIPSLIVYAGVNLAVCGMLRVHVPEPNPRPDRQEVISKGKEFIKLGFFLTISSFATLLADFLFKSWLNITASTVIVGLYTAGFTIVNRYVGLVFSAISVEYYPRLARIIHSREDVQLHVGHEITIALLVLTPLILFFIPLAGFLVEILYSSEFLDIVPFVTVAVIGTLFRAVSWCFGYVILAKGDGKIYVFTELLSSSLFLIINVYTYRTFGMNGMGYAYTIWYFLYFVSTALVYFKRFHYTVSLQAFTLLAAGTALGVASLLLTNLHWSAGLILAAVVAVPYGRKLLKIIKK